jgi:hypothetical protein
MNGHVRIPHDWVAAWRHEPRVIAFLAVYAHDEFFGTTRTVRDYAEVFDLRKSRVGRLMQKWQNHRLEAADDSGNQDWDNSGTERDKTAPQVPDIAQVTEGQRDNSGTQRDNSGTVPYLPKAETEVINNIHTSLPQGEATPPPNPLPSKAKAKSDSLTELARALWPKLVAEAALGGKVWVAKPRNLQLKAITTRLEEYGEENILLAVQGYRAKAQGADGDWDAMKYFDITSILRPSNIEGNIAAAPGSEVDSWAESERAIKRRMAEAREAEAGNLVRFDFNKTGRQ